MTTAQVSTQRSPLALVEGVRNMIMVNAGSLDRDTMDVRFAPVARPGRREVDLRIDRQDVRRPAANTSEENGKPGHQSPKPDAPLRSVGRTAIRLVHAVVLCGIVGLLIWQVVAFLSRSKDALATIVAAPLHEVRSPVDGVFVANGHMPNGTHVRKGQVLGWIRSPQLEADIQALRRKLDTLKRRNLLLEQRASESYDPLFRTGSGRESRQVVADIAAAESELGRLLRVQRQLRVVSPVTGQISNGGFSGSKAVETNDTVAYVWPDGGDLLVEVKAPLKAIHELIQANRVEARFSTVGGQAAVTARPIAGSLRVFTLDRGAAKKKELWGILQCQPTSIPANVAYPGPIGVL
jgi:biotin carboxyl carrier protein